MAFSILGIAEYFNHFLAASLQVTLRVLAHEHFLGSNSLLSSDRSLRKHLFLVFDHSSRRNSMFGIEVLFVSRASRLYQQWSSA